ncbi:conserved hypothetical protein [Ruegeria lacuscaerulensis ITI-1157]|nr:conserved hypothetical protein [Ruegeria lacuscaerulensis ITI-1157]
MTADHGAEKTAVIDVTCLKIYHMASSLTRPQDIFVAAERISGYCGARELLSGLPKAERRFGDRGQDANWFREALKYKGVRACIHGSKQRKTTARYDKRRYDRRNRIEFMLGRLKDWRRVATGYDRCPKVFPLAIALAAIVVN